MKLKTKRDEQGHWFENPDQTVYPWCGPYKNRAEMMEDKLGVERLIQTKSWKKIEESFQSAPLCNNEETPNGDE